MATPEHVAWLENTGEVIQTADGRQAEIWVLQHANDPVILSTWAKHFREHYCRDEDLPKFVEDTGLSNAEYLTTLKFPDATKAPGPSTRAGDFGEILVADFAEYVLGYWCPRHGRYEDRENRNVPSNGTDVMGFKYEGGAHSPDDELIVLESKAGFRPTTENRLQQAIDHSGKDIAREAMSLNAIKQRLTKINGDDAKRIGRFQNPADRPFKRLNAAVAVLDDEILAAMPLDQADASQHPNVGNLRLIIIRGTFMMDLVHALYGRAADEA